MELKNTHVHIGDEEINSGDIQEIIKPLWYSVNIYDGEEQYNADLRPFTLPQRYVFAAEWYIAEVNNGGHDQFFFNSTGIVWREALECFRAAGLAECAEILCEAVERMGGNPSLDRMERMEALDKLEPDFEDLDRRFYRLPEESVYPRITEYILSNRDSFYFDGNIELPDYGDDGMLVF